LELATPFRVLRRWWWLILIPVVIAAALTLPDLLRRGGGGGYSTMIAYSAAQSMEAIPRTEGDYQDIWLSSELTVDAFTEWVRGSAFAREVAEAATQRGVTLNPAALAIQSDNERSVGRIYLSWANPDELATIAESVIEVLQTRSSAYFAQLGGTSAEVTILHQAPVSAAPPPLVDRFGALIRIGLGLIAGIGLAALAHAFDPFLRRREDVEALGLRVVGSIPRK
jgi:capsular polysaccharide biosynthesis protein